MLIPQKTFQSEFWRQVNNDGTALRIMHKIPTEKHRRVVYLLETISDPHAERLAKGLAKTFAGIGPSRRVWVDLARKMRTVATDIDRLVGPDSGSKLPKLAEDCRSHAGYIKMALAMGSDPAETEALHQMTYRAFWKHLPMALLCCYLDAPTRMSFPQIEALISCAYRARGGDWKRPARRIEREYKGFRASVAANPGVSAVWSLIGRAFLTPFRPSTK